MYNYDPHWFWLALGGILLSLELIGAAGYFLWLGFSALIVGLLAWCFHISWPWLWCIFAILSPVNLLLWFRWQKNKDLPSQPLLNQREQQLIGYRTVLESPLVNMRGRVRIGDSSWRIQSKKPLSIGAHIVVIAIEGITLIVDEDLKKHM